MKQPRGFLRAVVRSALAVMLISAVLKLFGYGEKRILGHFFGAGGTLDAYLVALKISLLPYFALRGIMRSCVLPILTSEKNRSAARAVSFGFSLAIVILVAIVVLGLAEIIFAPRLVQFFASGFDPRQHAFCVHIVRWLIPTALVMILSQLLSLSLQVRKRFTIATAGECLQKMVYLGGIILLAVPLGFGWIIGAYWLGSAVAFFFLLAYHLKRLTNFGDFTLAREPLRQVGLLCWPIICGNLFSQFGALMQNRAASSLGAGSITALTFAQNIIDLPLFLVPFSLSIVLLPYFSEFADRKEIEKSFVFLAKCTRFLLVIFLPLAIFLFLFREPVTQLLFRGGQFGRESIGLTSQALAGLAPGLPVFALEMIFMIYFYACRRMVLSMACGLAATAAAVLLLPALARQLGLAGIGAYLPLARFFKVLLLTLCLPALGPGVPWRRVWVFFCQMTLALAPMALACWVGSGPMRGAANTRLAALAPPLAVMAALAAGIYGASLFLVRLPECKLMAAYFQNYGGKKTAPKVRAGIATLMAPEVPVLPAGEHSTYDGDNQ